MSGDAVPRRKVAVVTGVSRRSGIGAAIAFELAKDGWDLLLCGLPGYDEQMGLPAGEEWLTELRSSGARVEYLECDLSEPQAADELIAAAERLGPVTALVNNAAYSELTSIADLDADTLDRHYRVNMRAPALLSRAFTRLFTGEFGRIVNLTSGQGLVPMPAELAYAATKGGLEALTISLAAALAAKRVTVNAVDPGPTDSGWMTEEQRRNLASPVGRLGAPEDAARLVRFLLSDDARWITGQVIRSRGGL